MKRVFLFVLDSLGIGQMPDAAYFGDNDCNTLRRIADSSEFSIPNLLKLGIGNIDGVEYLPKSTAPLASVARLAERSCGKDTIIGHFEIAGIVSERPLPTYPEGFPEEILSAFADRVGRGVLCNRPYSGTEVIRDFGKQHLKTGDLIVYTSADSVFQIASHKSVVDVETLYKYCNIAREILSGEHAVGRVIARPFEGDYPEFIRSAERRDFSLRPPKQTMLDAISNNGQSVISIGKIYDIFSGQGITDVIKSHSNSEGMRRAYECLKQDFNGLCFINLVDFDMLYGHRQNVDGYAAALSEFDTFLSAFLNEMRDEDVLIITADHGCDPGDNSTDHSREYTPFLMYSPKISPKNFGTSSSFADVAATVVDILEAPFDCVGKSMWRK